MPLPIDIIPQVPQSSTYAAFVARLRAEIAEERDWNGELRAPKFVRPAVAEVPGDWSPQSVALAPAHLRPPPPAEPLGKTDIFAYPPPQGPEKSPQQLALITRFALQAGARHLLPATHKTQGCLRRLQFGKDDVDLIYSPEQKKAHLGNLQTCASVWACPVCATKISERRKKELEECLQIAHKFGWVVVMHTYTLRHKAGDTLEWLLNGMMEARRKGFSGPPWKKLKERCGFIGSIRALEVTHGENGWHPHVHELYFLESDKFLGKFFHGCRARWVNGLERMGMYTVNSHAVDRQVCDADIAAYVAKFGHDRAWNVEHELTKQVTKIGKTENRSPTQLLAAFTFGGDIEAGARWCEYAAAFHGSQQLRWSNGFYRRVFGKSRKQLTDEQVAERKDETGFTLAIIPPLTYRKIVADDAVPALLIAGSTGKFEAVKTFLAPYSRQHHLPSRDEFECDPELVVLSRQYPRCGEVELRDIRAGQRIRRRKQERNQVGVVDVASLWHWHRRGDLGSTRELRRRIRAANGAEHADQVTDGD